MLWLGLLVFLLLSLSLAGGEWAFRRERRHPWLEAWFEWLLLPLGRVFCLLAFIACAHPALYGLRDAPSVLELLTAAPGRVDRFVNLLFFAGLIPALPSLRRVPGLVLPVQGGVALALVFAWLAAAQGLQEPWLLPAPGLALVLLALSGLALATAALLSRAVENALLSQELNALLVLWLQLPILLVYGDALGRQLRS